MKNIILAGVAVLALAGTSVVYAQRHDQEYSRGSWWQRMHMTPEDRLAFLDARIAAVKAGLKLTAEQEKSWPAIESAVRDFAKTRIENANAKAPAAPDAKPADGKAPAAADANPDQPDDPVARLRQRAEHMAATAAALKRIADAADPLYKTLDEGQKRRLAFLTKMGGEHRFESWRERFGFSHHDGDRDEGRGFDRDRGFDHGRGHGGRDSMDDGSGRL
jgi:LTXXQ motif family protein